MPITLEKLFSPTVTTSFPFMDETIHVTFAPHRWTGEMQDLAEALTAELTADGERLGRLRADAKAALDEAQALEDADGDASVIDRLREEADTLAREADDQNRKLKRANMRAVRESLAKFLVSWDVLDGDTPIPTDLATLNKLPDLFLSTVLVSLGEENSADPQKAPESDESSSTDPTSAPSPTGTTTSPARKRSGSARSSSTNGRAAPAAIPSGAPGR